MCTYSSSGRDSGGGGRRRRTSRGASGAGKRSSTCSSRRYWWRWRWRWWRKRRRGRRKKKRYKRQSDSQPHLPDFDPEWSNYEGGNVYFSFSPGTQDTAHRQRDRPTQRDTDTLPAFPSLQVLPIQAAAGDRVEVVRSRALTCSAHFNFAASPVGQINIRAGY